MFNSGPYDWLVSSASASNSDNLVFTGSWAMDSQTELAEMGAFCRFRLRFRRAYDSAYDSDYDSNSVSSENQPLDPKSTFNYF